MAYHNIDNGGYTINTSSYGGLVIDNSGKYYNSSITIHTGVTEEAMAAALFQQVFHRLINELMEGITTAPDPLMANLIDAVAEMEIASLPSYIRFDSTFGNMDGRVLDAVHLQGIHQRYRNPQLIATTEPDPIVREYLDNQKSLSMDERYMLACLSTDHLYCRASTILRYEHQQVRSLL